jgi:hypothetical protein
LVLPATVLLGRFGHSGKWPKRAVRAVLVVACILVFLIGMEFAKLALNNLSVQNRSRHARRNP